MDQNSPDLGKADERSVSLPTSWPRECPLTPREMQVLQLIAGGNSNKWIARILAIGGETAKTHVRNIIAKLGARDRTHAVALGMRRGLINFE